MSVRSFALFGVFGLVAILASSGTSSASAYVDAERPALWSVVHDHQDQDLHARTVRVVAGGTTVRFHRLVVWRTATAHRRVAIHVRTVAHVARPGRVVANPYGGRPRRVATAPVHRVVHSPRRANWRNHPLLNLRSG